MAPRRPRKLTIVFNAGDGPANTALGFQAFGASVANYSGQWLQLPGNNQFAAPGSRGTFAMDGQETGQLEWGAPPGNIQPATIAGQDAVVTFTEEPLPDNGGPLLLSTTVASFNDGTAAAPGLFNNAQTNMGFFRAGVDILGAAVGGAEVLRFTTTGIQVTGAITPNADGTRDLGSAALRFRDAYLSSSLRIGAAPAAAGAIRIGNFAAITGRNNANNADIEIVRVSATDFLQFDNTVKGSVFFGDISVLNGGPLNQASVGALRLNNATYLQHRNAGNTTDILTIGVAADNILRIGGGQPSIHSGTFYLNNAQTNAVDGSASGDLRLMTGGTVDIRYNPVAVGGGAGATLGLTGNANTPTVAAQNSWLVISLNGTISYLPIWR